MVLSDDKWEQINRQLLSQAAAEKTELACEVNIDCTAIETNIHSPNDSNQLFNEVRVLTLLFHSSKKAYDLKDR